MPEPTIPGISATSDSREIADQLAKIQKYLQWLLSSLDSLNVKEITTNFTRVHSRYGETIIDGPQLLMYDRQATPQLRLRQGYDMITGDFLFELYNKSGAKTVGIDSNGDATFTGTITGSAIIGGTITGGTITGSTIQTAAAGSSRIVITSNSLKTYYWDSVLESESLMGPAWGIGASKHYGDLSFFDDGIETFRIENALGGGGWDLRPMNGGILIVGYGGATTMASGTWSFANASSVSGLATSTGTTGTGGADGHTHSIPSLSVVKG